MKQIILSFLIAFSLSSVPAFAEKASCFSVFAKKNQEPLTLDTIRSLKFKKRGMPVTALLTGATATGVGAGLGFIPLALIGLPSGIVVSSTYAFSNAMLKKMLEDFKQRVISKYSNETKEESPYRDINLIYRAAYFAGNGLSKNDSKRLVQFLVDQGEDINHQNSFVIDGKNIRDGYAPIHQAAKEDRPGAIQVLYELGGDIYIKNNQGQTPLEVALAQNSKKAQKALSRIMKENENRP